MFDNGAKTSITTHPELLHSIQYYTDTVQSFNKQRVQIIGKGIYDLKIGHTILQFEVLILESSNTMYFPIIISEQDLCQIHHATLHSHYQPEQCYMYNRHTNENSGSIEKLNGYLTLSVPPNTILHHIHDLSTTIPDIHKICGHFNKKEKISN